MIAANSDTATTLRCLRELFGKSPPEKISIRLWDGTSWPDENHRSATLVLRHPGALREMLAAGTEMGLAEAFLHEDFDVEGDTVAAVELADLVRNQPRGGLLDTVAKFYHLQRLPAREDSHGGWRIFSSGRAPQHTMERDRSAVSFHYDLSNDFYRLWLDERMVYSCAYFQKPDDDIHTAQTAKLEHLCRKLRLRRGQRLLDIGCGWGGLAIYAARHYGAKVTGVTLSERQAEMARARVAEAGLEDEVSIHVCDYRELNTAEYFDAIVSVGMAEHVGPDHLAGYFARAAWLLKPGGLFMNHAISESVRPRNNHGPSFIDEYVFPDADVPHLPLVLQAAESAGLEIRDVENLREHYAITLRHWLRRLEANHEQAVTFINEPTYRVWRVYLAGSAYGFDRCNLAIYQSLLSKPDAQGRAHLPLTRRNWCD